MPFVFQIIILRRYTVLYIIWRDVESNKEIYTEMVFGETSKIVNHK